MKNILIILLLLVLNSPCYGIVQFVPVDLLSFNTNQHKTKMELDISNEFINESLQLPMLKVNDWINEQQCNLMSERSV